MESAASAVVTALLHRACGSSAAPAVTGKSSVQADVLPRAVGPSAEQQMLAQLNSPSEPEPKAALSCACKYVRHPGANQLFPWPSPAALPDAHPRLPPPFTISTGVSIGIFAGRALLPVCDRQLPCKLQSDKVFTRMKADSKAQVFNSISCCFFFLSNQLCLDSPFRKKAACPFLVPSPAHALTASVLSPTLSNAPGCRRDFPPCSFCTGIQIPSIPRG